MRSALDTLKPRVRKCGQEVERLSSENTPMEQVMMMVVMVMMMVVMVIVTILDQVRVDQEDKRTNMYMTCKHTK